ncbi:hypothetical protein EON67_12335 [archaeon]|nr:MAG: hypothetical protein EON67_12335 [archaeon]
MHTCAYVCRPEVVFCGYSLPHPSEAKVNMRIQTKAGATAADAFRAGLRTLIDTATHIGATFDAALESPAREAGVLERLHAAAPSSTPAAAAAEPAKEERSKSKRTAAAALPAAEAAPSMVVDDSEYSATAASLPKTEKRGSKGKR